MRTSPVEVALLHLILFSYVSYKAVGSVQLITFTSNPDKYSLSESINENKNWRSLPTEYLDVQNVVTKTHLIENLKDRRTVSHKNQALKFSSEFYVQEYGNYEKTTNKETGTSARMESYPSERGLMTTKEHSVLDDLCYQYRTCEKPLGIDDPWYCNCDERCEEYRDCCLEYNQTGNGNLQRQYECVKRNSGIGVYGFFAVSLCPLNYGNSKIVEKCHQGNIQQSGPLVVCGKNVIYKNKYCALCQNATEFVSYAIQFYDIFYENLEAFQNLSRKKKIEYAFNYGSYRLLAPENTDSRICVVGLIENENFLCQQYINPVKWENNLYRNSFCVNTINDCFAETYNPKDSEIQSLSVIFSFTPTALEGTEPCQQWTEEMNDVCLKEETYINYELNLEYYLISNTSLTKKVMNSLGLLAAWTFEITNQTQLTFNVEVETNKDHSAAKLKFRLKIVKRSFMHEIERLEESLLDEKLTIIFKNENSNDTALITGTSQFSESQIRPSETFEISLSYTFYTEVYRLSYFRINQSSYTVDELCSTIAMEVREAENGAVGIKSLQCQNKNDHTDATKSVLSIITYVCFSVSSLALICFLVFFRKEKLIDNIPSNNLENLSISLLISNLLFMCGVWASSISKLCYAIGILLHYIWLTVFTYMTIAVLYIVTNLVQMRSRNPVGNDQNLSKRRVITIMGLLIPLCFVGPAVAVDRFGPEYYSLGYGGSVCFPNRYPSNIIFFSGPVVFSILVNLMSLAQIITQICRVRLSMRNMRRSATFKDAKVYLRIVILSGVFWVTGIAAAVFEMEWLDYIFTVLCGLQGLCITIASLTTNRVQCRKSKEDMDTI